jgi:hypothetical protein
MTRALFVMVFVEAKGMTIRATEVTLSGAGNVL